MSSTLLGAACTLFVVVGMANAGKEPVPTIEVPAQPAVPAGWVCPGTENVENIHVALSPPPDYFAQGKVQGMTDDQARANVAQFQVAQQELQDQLMQTVATLPRPPCP